MKVQHILFFILIISFKSPTLVTNEQKPCLEWSFTRDPRLNSRFLCISYLSVTEHSQEDEDAGSANKEEAVLSFSF